MPVLASRNMEYRQEKFSELRRQFPVFAYQSFRHEATEKEVFIQYRFSIYDKNGKPAHVFEPCLRIPLRPFYRLEVLSSGLWQSLVFHCGMVEIASYWKCCCPPETRIECGLLSEAQLDWFKKLYFNGLGEFFYLNGISCSFNDFMHLRCTPPSANLSGAASVPSAASGSFPGQENRFSCPFPAPAAMEEGFIVPVGGGKDSVVSLEILKQALSGKIRPMVINPRGATSNCCLQAGFGQKDCAIVERPIHPHLLELNAQGFLNGHTPFSAMLAFVSLLVSALSGYRHIALSNENSANESTVIGQGVNHQYSKSLEFENDFRHYTRHFLFPGFDYFSFLRPLNEIGIARLFATFPLYHSIFRSCNAGSKTDSWCGKCPKCLFAFIILCPFLGIGKTSRIFGKNLLDDKSLQPFIDELCGRAPVKPFECVGTLGEVNWCLQQLRPYAKGNALLEHYFEPMPQAPSRWLLAGDAGDPLSKQTPVLPGASTDGLLEEFSTEHHVPDCLLPFLEKAVEKARCREDKRSDTGHLIRNPLPEAVREAFLPLLDVPGPIALLGFGREGLSSYRFVRRLLPRKEIRIIDRNEEVERNPALSGDPALSFLTGEACMEAFAAQMRAGAFGLVLKTPGISLKDFPDLLAHSALRSQTDLFLQVYSPQIIGITGTKGKSTTALLAWHLLSAFRPCLLAGNMGLPVFEIVDEIGPETWIVCEFSAHQLEQAKRPPHTGVLLNLYEEHLDHYRSYLDYQQAKMKIAGNDSGNGFPDSVFIFNQDEETVRERVRERFPGFSRNRDAGSFPPHGSEPAAILPGGNKSRSRITGPGRTLLSFSSEKEDADLHVDAENRIVARLPDGKKEIVFDLSQPHPLIGKHNVLNLMAALLAAHSTGVPYACLASRIASFKPLPHRLEYAGCIDGRHFFNDSISTIPQAAIAAVESIEALPFVKGVDTLILGGFDRGIDYAPLAAFLQKRDVPNLAFTGKAGRRMLSLLRERLAENPAATRQEALPPVASHPAAPLPDTPHPAATRQEAPPQETPDWKEGDTGVLADASGKTLATYLVSDHYPEIAAWAKKKTRPGYACVLSPAAASYDMFRDFAHRGETFKKLVLEEKPVG